MTDYGALSDSAVLVLLGRDVAQARITKEFTQAELAAASGVSLPTIARLERGKGINLVNLVRVLRALGLLERLGDLFPDSNESPLAQLERAKKTAIRHRVRRGTSAEQQSSSWVWGDEEAVDEAEPEIEEITP